MSRREKYLIFVIGFLFLPLVTMIVDLVVPIYRLPQYLVSVAIYVGGIGTVFSIVMFIVISIKGRQKNVALRKVSKVTISLITALLISNLWIYQIITSDFYGEGWYGEAIGKEIKNGKYYITFELDSGAWMQECTAEVYEVIVKGEKYMAKAYGNTKLGRNVVYKVEEQGGAK